MSLLGGVSLEAPAAEDDDPEAAAVAAPAEPEADIIPILLCVPSTATPIDFFQLIFFPDSRL